ncbi:MAG: hypothetical protein ABIC68_02625 [Candidatus Omnitrophota bacterium]
MGTGYDSSTHDGKSGGCMSDREIADAGARNATEASRGSRGDASDKSSSSSKDK